MITCPKCQTPNPDNASSCLACGAGLAGQQLADALDRDGATGEQAAPAPEVPDALPPSGAPPSLGAAPAPIGGDLLDGAMGAVPGQVGQPLDPAAAQAEINQFMAEQAARKKKKALIWAMIGIAAVGVIAFLAIRSAQKKAKQEEIAKFYLAWRKVDDNPMADFWRCVVRAKHLDVRLAKDNLMLTDGLTKAYKNFPKGQPRRIKSKCLPLLEDVKKGLADLKPMPEGMAAPIDGLTKVMDEIKTVFDSYITKLAARADQTANEQTIMKASAAFHVEDPETVDQAVGYTLILECAVPDLIKTVAKIKKAPDTQPLVEYMYKQCKDDAKAFSDKLRKGECFDKIKNLGAKPEKPKFFQTFIRKMSGDDRDRMALDYCFKRANRGFFTDDLIAIGKIWVKYRGERKKVLDEVFSHKEGAGEKKAEGAAEKEAH